MNRASIESKLLSLKTSEAKVEFWRREMLPLFRAGGPAGSMGFMGEFHKIFPGEMAISDLWVPASFEYCFFTSDPVEQPQQETYPPTTIRPREPGEIVSIAIKNAEMEEKATTIFIYDLKMEFDRDYERIESISHRQSKIMFEMKPLTRFIDKALDNPETSEEFEYFRLMLKPSYYDLYTKSPLTASVKAKYVHFHNYLLELLEDLKIEKSIQEGHIERIKWASKPALFGKIFYELAEKGHIIPPKRGGETNYRAYARLLVQFFDIEKSDAENIVDAIAKEINPGENKNTLSKHVKVAFENAFEHLKSDAV